jgi:hypothetical protein
MLTFKIKELLGETLATARGENAFLEAVETIEQVFIGIAEGVEAIGTNTNNAGYANQIYASLHSLSERISTVSPRKFYSALETFHEILGVFRARIEVPSTYLDRLVEEIENFAALYDTYLAKPSAANAAPLVLEAPLMKRRLHDFLGATHLFNSILEDAPAENENEGVLSILLPGTLDLHDFIARLEAIASMYSELCQLLDISEVDQPLHIAKIESGSLWAKLAGSTLVVTLMTQFIHSSASYLYQTYTAQGQIASIPSKVESLVLDLRQKLKVAGIKTGDLDEHLAKSAHAIAKDLNTLLERQPSITLNGVEISVAEEAAKRQISARTVPKLTNGSAQ